MKYTAWILGLLLFTTFCLQGQRGSGKNPNGGNGAGMGMRRTMIFEEGDVAQPPANMQADSLSPLKQFVSLSDTQLIAIRDVIDQILAMSPEEREALRQKIAEYEALDPEKQQLIRQGWGHVSETARDDWREMMQSFDKKERDKIREKLGTLSLEKKIEYRLKLIEDWKKEHEGADKGK